MKRSIINCLQLASALFIVVFFIIFNSCSKNGLNGENPANGKFIDSADSHSSAEVFGHVTQDSAGLVVDQSNVTFVHYFTYNEYAFRPFGQEIVPTLYALDAVELQFDDASCGLSGGNGGDLKVQIRQSAINGPVLGTSATVHFVNCFDGVKRFDFPSFIPVIPGQKYVIETVYVSGNTSAMHVDIGPSPLYLQGSLIFEGIIDPNKDLWFREGLDKSIARTRDQALNGGWKNLVRSDGTTFQNQGDCMQYINAGK